MGSPLNSNVPEGRKQTYIFLKPSKTFDTMCTGTRASVRSEVDGVQSRLPAWHLFVPGNICGDREIVLLPKDRNFLKMSI